MTANTEPILILADIIQSEMVLTNEQVMIYNQKWDIPDDLGLFIVLSYVSVKTYGSKNAIEVRNDGVYEVQSINNLTTIGVDIYSVDETARQRKEEIILALNSTFAQQQMEATSMKIFRVPTDFQDVSFVEASARLNRFHGDVSMMYMTNKEKKIEYYDTFPPIQTQISQ